VKAPELDGRDARAVVEQALALAGLYVPPPRWTPRAGDPGRDLVELFGDLVEVLIERYNRVPERSFLSFLELAGVERSPGHPAGVPVTFLLAGDAPRAVEIAAGTRVATKQTESTPARVFELRDAFQATTATVRRLVALTPSIDAYLDVPPGTASPKPEDVALGALAPAALDPSTADRATRVERRLYLADDRLFGNEEPVDATLELEVEGGAEYFAPDSVRWSRFDPELEDWADVEVDVDLLPNGIAAVHFRGLAPIEPHAVRGREARWIAARPLAPVRPSTPVPTLRAVRGSVLTPEGSRRAGTIDYAFARTLPVVLDDRPVHPFGSRPRFGDTFYLGSRSALGPDVAECSFSFALAPYSDAELLAMYAGARGDDAITTVVRWEYLGPQGAWLLLDEVTHTLGYDHATGTITRAASPTTGRLVAGQGNGTFFGDGADREEFSITLPDTMTLGEVFGREAYWVRAVLVSREPYGKDAIVLPGAQPDPSVPGDTGEPPAVVGPVLVPPILLESRVFYVRRGASFHVRDVMTSDAFAVESHAPSTDAQPLDRVPFVPLEERVLGGERDLAAEPALYVGFDRPLDNGFISLYVQLDTRSALDELVVEGGAPQVQWEFRRARGGWAPLDATDGTGHLTASGVVAFVGPADMATVALFPALEDEPERAELAWIRARVVGGRYTHPPRVVRVLTNTAMADQQTTARSDVVIGSSGGRPDQRLEVVGPTILAGELWVREPERPTAQELEELARDHRRHGGGEASPAPDQLVDVRRDGETGPLAVWVRWIRVPTFFASGPASRHYTLDAVGRTVRFGDGVNGRVPPAGRDGIALRGLRRGGGAVTGAAARALAVQEPVSPLPFVDRVFNVEPVVGGSEPWTRRDTLELGPRRLKNRGRAVTSEDFEWMVREAFGEVARVRCLATRAPRPDGTLGVALGAVTVVVVPRGELPQASRSLLARVEAFLGTRMLGTVFDAVHAVGPVVHRVDVEVRVRASDPRESHLVRRRVELALEAYLHPLAGGLRGEGWAFGRSVPLSEVEAAVERTPGVHHVERARFAAAPAARSLSIEPHGLAASGSHAVEVF